MKIKSVYKTFEEDGSEYYVIGRTNLSGKTVTKITYHEPQGEGDAHYCDIEFDDGGKTRLFRPDAIDWEMGV